jgi:prefoldin subunit 5
MSGQLVHTNTIKVQLGAEYIVEYSARQAREVARRRLAGKFSVAATLRRLTSEPPAIEDRMQTIKGEIEALNAAVDEQLDLPGGFAVNERNEVCLPLP